MKGYVKWSETFCENIYGWIHGDPSTFWKDSFLRLLISGIGWYDLENVFGYKKG